MHRLANHALLTLVLALQAAFGAMHPDDESSQYLNEVVRLQVGFAAGTGVLREDQVEAMVGILRDADQAFQRARPAADDYTHITTEEWLRLQTRTLRLTEQRDQQIRDRAAAVLTPAQFSSLDARIRRERGHDELLRIAALIVPLGKSGVTRQSPGRPGPYLAGVNDDMLIRDPEYLRAWQQQARREVESTYADVPPSLNLPPQIADQLFGLLVRQQFARIENPPPRSARRLKERLVNEERELSALLGERGCARFLEFRSTYGYRFRVKHLQVDIGAGPDALRQSQVEALIAAWRDADQATGAGREFRRRRDARLHELATAFLTPPQLVALDAWLQRDPG